MHTPIPMTPQNLTLAIVGAIAAVIFACYLYGWLGRFDRWLRR